MASGDILTDMSLFFNDNKLKGDLNPSEFILKGANVVEKSKNEAKGDMTKSKMIKMPEIKIFLNEYIQLVDEKFS